MTNDKELERLEELSAKATPGPWRSMRNGNSPCRGTLVGVSHIEELPRPYNEHAFAERAHRELSLFRDEDADLIAEMRNALPALIAEVRRLRAENATHVAARAALVSMAAQLDGLPVDVVDTGAIDRVLGTTRDDEWLITKSSTVRRWMDSLSDAQRLRAERDALWKLLDDVDTADDIAKDNDALFRGLARKAQQKRRAILISRDGQTLERP